MKKMECKPLKPGPRYLFKTIERFMKFANIMRINWIHIVMGLLHVNILLEIAM